MTVLFLLSHDCQTLLIYSNDFNICTDRATIHFNVSHVSLEIYDKNFYDIQNFSFCISQFYIFQGYYFKI